MLRWQGEADTMISPAFDKWDVDKYYKGDIYKNNLNDIRYVEVPDVKHEMDGRAYGILSDFGVSSQFLNFGYQLQLGFRRVLETHFGYCSSGINYFTLLKKIIKI
jgi:hypothetical protein